MHLILFDIDGTLLQGKGTGRRALVRTFAEFFDKDPQEFPFLKDVHFAGSTDEVIFADIARVLGIPEPVVHGAGSPFEAAYVANLRRSIAQSPDNQVSPGVPELLEQLHRHPQVTLGLLTGNWEAGARTKLDPHGLNRFFSFGGFGNDGRERSHLARCAVERAEETTGCRFAAKDTLVIGDTISDVAAARAHDFLSVGVLTGWADAETLKAAGADVVVPDLTASGGFPAWLDTRWTLTPSLSSPTA